MAVELSLGETVTIILVIAALFVFIFPFFGVIGESATAASARAKCALSIEVKLLGEGVTNLLNPFEINCDRRIIQFSGEEAVVFNHEGFDQVTSETTYTYYTAQERQRGDGVVRVPQPHQLTTDADNLTADVMQALAYEAGECWKLFFRGREDIIDDTWLLDKTTCVICAELSLNPEEVPASWPEKVNTSHYLENTDHHVTDARAGSYADFLYTPNQPSESENCEPYSFNNHELEIRDGQTYAVAFYRDDSTIANDCQAVTIAPAQELARTCQVILN